MKTRRTHQQPYRFGRGEVASPTTTANLFLGTLFLCGLLVFAGCTGCGQKTAPTAQKDAPLARSEPTAPVTQQRQNGTPTPTADTPVAQQQETPATKARPAPHLRDFNWVPWEPTVIPPDVDERSDKRVHASYQHYEAGEISLDEHIEKMNQINAEELGNLTYARRLVENGAGPAKRYALKALAENPDDFDTLLTALHLGTWPLYDEDGSYGEEQEKVCRRMYEMNPNHPYVLHWLALSIFPRHPTEALGYAQKAQQLDPRYIPIAVDGMCYIQMGDYENAVSSFQRAYAAAPRQWKQGTLSRLNYAISLLGLPEDPPFLKLKRAKGMPLTSYVMWSH